MTKLFSSFAAGFESPFGCGYSSTNSGLFYPLCEAPPVCSTEATVDKSGLCRAKGGLDGEN